MADTENKALYILEQCRTETAYHDYQGGHNG